MIRSPSPIRWIRYFKQPLYLLTSSLICFQHNTLVRQFSGNSNSHQQQKQQQKYSHLHKNQTSHKDMNFFDQEEQNHRSQQHQKTTATNGGHNDAEQQKQQKQRRTLKKKGVLYDADTGEVVECLFCKIHQRQEPGRIEYEDEKYVVFHTIDPATHLHLLVTPRQHITSVHSLKGHEGAQLIRELIEIGKRALKEENCSHAKFCFHIPPYTSIDHLHLHAIADHANHASWWYKIKYPTSSNWYCKNAMDLVHELEKQDSSV